MFIAKKILWKNILTMFFHGYLNTKKSLVLKILKVTTKQDFMHIFLKDIYLWFKKYTKTIEWPWIFEEIN